MNRIGVIRKYRAWIVGAPLSGRGCGSETRVLEMRVCESHFIVNAGKVCVVASKRMTTKSVFQVNWNFFSLSRGQNMCKSGPALSSASSLYSWMEIFQAVHIPKTNMGINISRGTGDLLSRFYCYRDRCSIQAALGCLSSLSTHSVCFSGVKELNLATFPGTVRLSEYRVCFHVIPPGFV